MATDRRAALGRGLELGILWLSPAALLAAGAGVLADGTRGLAIPLALAAGAALGALVLAPAGAGEPAALARPRWPAPGPSVARVLAAVEAGPAMLFAWAQLAAAREVGQALDWPGWLPVLAVAGVAVGLLLGDGSSRRPGRLGALAGAVAAAGWAVPLAAVLAVTTPWWPRVWSEVASRPRVAVAGDSHWTRQGRPVRGPLPGEATMAFSEEHRVVLLGRGRAELRHWEGGQTRVDVPGRAEVQLRAGDRLTVTGGLVVRFQGERRVPDAPASGPEWLDPPGPRAGWLALLGLGLTLGLGTLGCPGTVGAGSSREPASARLGAALAVVGAAAATLWALYAGWLMPEAYAGGIAGPEPFGLPAEVPALPPASRGALRALALGGLLAGAAGAAPAVLRGLGRPGPLADRRPALVLLAAGAWLAAAAPVPSWSLLVAGLGLAASAAAPAALLAAWSERLSPRGLALGGLTGLVLHVGLVALGLGLGVMPGQPAPASPGGVLLAWPVLAALPAGLLVAWRTGTGPGAVRRGLASRELEALRR